VKVSKPFTTGGKGEARNPCGLKTLIEVMKTHDGVGKLGRKE